MKKILILANNDVGLYNFRKELIEKLLEEGYEVVISLPYGDKVDKLIELGCKYIKTDISRRGTNPVTDFLLFVKYIGMLKKEKPDFVLSYTIKPNVYGGISCELCRVPYIANITGLGTAVTNVGALQKFTLTLYKFALKRVEHVFFQNKQNLDFFISKEIVKDRYTLLPGSGVNLKRFSTLEYPDEKTTEFVFIARIMKAKGIDHYLEAAKYIRAKYPDTVFHVCGYCEEGHKNVLHKLHLDGTIVYHGNVDDVSEIFKTTHCMVNPSYHEGMSNVLLEASASGRPCLCSDIAGCREIVEDGKTGFVFEPQSTESLIEALEKFISTPLEEKKHMGIEARKHVEKFFDRNIVIDEYMNKIF